MKVLALTVLILAVGYLEAGVVKREAPNPQQITEYFESWFQTIKSSTDEWVQKLQNGEIQAQAGQLLESTKAQTDPIKAELDKFFAKIIEAGKSLAA